MALDAVLGPVFLGLLVSTLLTGIVLLQTYLYCLSCGRDARLVKIIVGVVVASQVAAQICLTITTYSTFVSSFGKPALELFPHVFPVSLGMALLFGAIAGHISEAYFVYRLHKLVGSWWISVPIWLIVAACFGFSVAIVAGGISGVFDFSGPPHVIVTGVFICAAAVDLLTAVLLCVTFRKRSKGVMDKEMKGLVRRISLYAIETGLLTSIVAIAAAIALHTHKGALYMAFFMNLSGLFANALLASMNNRIKTREETTKSKSAQVEFTTARSGSLYSAEKYRSPMSTSMV